MATSKWSKVEADVLAGSKHATVINPVTGLGSFGYIPKITHRGDTIQPGHIVLRVGRHFGINRGFGVNHIWVAHQLELTRLGYDSVEKVAQFVADIIQPETPIYCEFADIAGNHRTSVLRTSLGLVILEPKLLPTGEYVHSVVTAYTKRRADGTLIGKTKKAPS